MRKFTDILESPVVAMARARRAQVVRRNMDARRYQEKALMDNIGRSIDTRFGRDHALDQVRCYEDYREAVPVREFGQFEREYFQKVYAGDTDVLTPGRCEYLLTTGGTTAGRKLIPATSEHLEAVRRGAVDAGLFYMAHRNSADIFHGRQLVLGGSWKPELHECGARIMKISAAGPSSIPAFIRNRLMAPDRETNEIEDFYQKMDVIARQTRGMDITYMASTPVWLMSLMDRVRKLHGLTEEQTMSEIWPSLRLCFYSGAALGTYEEVFRKWLGPDVYMWELYAATEAFFAAMDDPEDHSLLVIPDSKFFYEFVPIEDYGMDNPRRVPLWEVETDQEYAVIVNNPSGLFGYSIGDTVRFTSTAPYRLRVTGRTALFLNTVGEHMTGEVVDRAVAEAQQSCDAQVLEYTVGPAPMNGQTAPGHEWVFEYVTPPSDEMTFIRALDRALMLHHSSYAWYRKANAIRFPELESVPQGTFRSWVATYKNNDPQTKVPRLKNDRCILEQVEACTRAPMAAAA